MPMIKIRYALEGFRLNTISQFGVGVLLVSLLPLRQIVGYDL